MFQGLRRPGVKLDGFLIVIHKVQVADLAAGQPHRLFDAPLQQLPLIHIGGLLAHLEQGFKPHVADQQLAVGGLQFGGAPGHQLFQMMAVLLQFGGDPLVLGDIEAVTDVADKVPRPRIQRNAVVHNPAIGSIAVLQPVFHIKRAAGVKGVEIVVKTVLKVVGMHAFGPAVALFLFEGAAGEGQPSGVEPDALGMDVGAPDEGGRLVQQGGLQLVGFAQFLFS